MNRTQVQLKTLTPIHIGSGNHYMPKNDYLYFSEEHQLGILDIEAIFDLFGKEQLDQWISVIDKGEDLLEVLKKKSKSIISAEALSSKTLDVIGEGPGESEVKALVQTGLDQTPYIPGSSLKGVIRTAILNRLISQDKAFVMDDRHLSFKAGHRTIFKDSQLIAHYFGKKDRTNRNGEIQLDGNKDFMRMLRVSDFTFTASTQCQKLEVINQQRHGWGLKRGEVRFLECIPAKAEATGDFQIPQALLNIILNGQYEKTEYIKKHHHLLNPSSLTEIINTLTKSLLAAELKFWDEEGFPTALGGYVDTLEFLKETADHCTAGECVLRIGAGSGWEFMTGAWTKNPEYIEDDTWFSLRDFVQKKRYHMDVSFPKTRKLLTGGMPLGFLKMKM